MGSYIHGAHKDNMAARKQLVDMMFVRFDVDNNGQIDASELSQVRKCHFKKNEFEDSYFPKRKLLT